MKSNVCSNESGIPFCPINRTIGPLVLGSFSAVVGVEEVEVEVEVEAMTGREERKRMGLSTVAWICRCALMEDL